MSGVLRCIVLCLAFVATPASAFFGLFEPDTEPVKERLKDPYSAKFHDVVDIGEGVVCGQVNSKNAMGAYTGKEPFAIKGKSAYFAKESPDEYKFLCVTFAQCVANKRKPSASACMEDATAKRETTRKDPRNASLRSRGQKACDNWYTFNRKPSNGYVKVADCKVAVNRCVDNFAQQGYQRVAQCMMGISMVASQENNIAYGLD